MTVNFILIGGVANKLKSEQNKSDEKNKDFEQSIGNKELDFFFKTFVKPNQDNHHVVSQ